MSQIPSAAATATNLQSQLANGPASQPQLVNTANQARSQGHHKSTHSNGSLSSHTPTVVGSHYKIGKKIGEGSFGVIYEGICQLLSMDDQRRCEFTQRYTRRYKI